MANEWIQSCPVQPPPERQDEVVPKDSISLISQGSKKSSHASHHQLI